MDELRNYSVLDFVRSQEKSDLCRLLFCSNIKFSSEEVLKFFSRYATQHFANEVTGLLLVYPDSVIHLLESTENKIFEISSHFVNAQPKFFDVSKCFPVEISVNERFFDKWYTRKINENYESLKNNEIPKTTDDENFENTRDAYYRFIDDFYNLCNELRKSRAISLANLSEMLDTLGSPGNPLLPDERTLKFILKSPWGDSLELLVEDYWHGVCPKEVDDEVWPFPRYHCPLVAKCNAKPIKENASNESEVLIDGQNRKITEWLSREEMRLTLDILTEHCNFRKTLRRKLVAFPIDKKY